MRSRLCVLAPLIATVGVGRLDAQTVTPDPRKWETVTFDFTGPTATELDGRSAIGGPTATPNPFLDYKLQLALLSPSGRVYDVPGFFAGDGQGGAAGDTWRVRFTPDEAGEWHYFASFREGTNVAVDLDPLAGSPSDMIFGTVNNFTVGEPSPDATGHFKTGRLEYVGGHYLKRRDGGYWLKSGADSPENWLGYKGFDNSQTKGVGGKGLLHEFDAHLADWRPGDPDWDTPDFSFPSDHDGRRIVGAVNYLADRGVNSIYFLPMNIGGDGRDSHPYAALGTPEQLAGDPANDNLHFDLSKLEQWETFFRHTQSRDMLLHFVLGEAEEPNKRELDDATLGVERKLFYREMVARFGHHNAVQWNLSEEYNLFFDLGADAVKEFAGYLSAIDPYDHPTTVHNARDPSDTVEGPWAPFIGEADFDLTSLQWARQADVWGDIVEDYRAASTAAGRPLVVMIDEPESPARIDLGPAEHNNQGADAARRFMTWDIYLSGGGGVEWFIHNRDQGLEDFSEVNTSNGVTLDLDRLWADTRIAREFFEEHLPFWEMTPSDDLIRNEDADYGGAEVFAKQGEVYAFYLPDASNDDGPGGAAPELDLTAEAGAGFLLRWFNPRTGQFEGDLSVLVGGDWVSLGATPDGFGTANDWVGLLTLSSNPLPGDYNRDGLVDASDFTVWRDTLGDSVPVAGDGADGDGDGMIDQGDFAVWRASLGEIAVASVIPEPSAFALLIPLAGALARTPRGGYAC